MRTLPRAGEMQPIVSTNSRTGLARPVIPKRGEKDFEPSAAGGSGLQMHVLDRARAAMFEALKATRSTSRQACV